MPDPTTEPTIEGEQSSLEDRVAELERIVRAHIGEPVPSSSTVTADGPFYAHARVSNGSETLTGATGFTDLATDGPEITITVAESGVLIVGIATFLKHGSNTDFNGAHMSFDLGTAGDTNSVFDADFERSIGNPRFWWVGCGASWMFEGLTPGQQLVAHAKYRAGTDGVNASFRWREIWAYSPGIVTATAEEVPVG